MACLDMYNSEQHKGPPISPRISFSNDFVDSSASISHQITKQERSRDQAPSDFEFSVTNYSMMSGADELFFKGRLLPFKHNNQRTIRDELLAGDEEEEDRVSRRPPKGSSPTRWKGLLGLKRSHIGSKKLDKATGGYIDTRRPTSSQESLSEGGKSCRDV